jgi:hypothetical protein
MDAIVHKHPATLQQLLGNIFDVAQCSSLEHYRSSSRIPRKTRYFFGRLNKTDEDFGTHS